MSHVSDGELHAYLDEALEHYPSSHAQRIREHVESCESCRLRLEDERGARAQAATILESGAPEQIEPPPFEEIERRRSAPDAIRRRANVRMVRLTRLSWAASVVLALGLGWVVGRQPGVLTLPTGDELAGFAGTPSSASADFRPAEVAQEPLTVSRPAADSDLEPRDQNRSSVLNEEGTAELVADLDEEVALLQERRANTVAADLDPLSGRAVASQLTVTESAAAQRVGGLADARARREAEIVQLSAAPVRATPSQVAALPRAPANARIDQPARFELSPTAEKSDLEAVDDLSGQVLPDRSLVIPDLTILSVEWITLATGSRALRVVQRLAGDTTTVELLHGGVGSDPILPPFGGSERQQAASASFLGDLPPGVNQVTGDVRPGEGWVVIRGRLSQDRLRELLSVLR